jgi:hypothetical protein
MASEKAATETHNKIVCEDRMAHARDAGDKHVERLDYCGGHEKTNPAEIGLVRKLDKWIMPTLWLM